MNRKMSTHLLAVLVAGALLVAWFPASSWHGAPLPQVSSKTAAPSPTPMPAPPQPAPLVTLSAVPSASSYSAGSPIGIAATLTNGAGGALGLSDLVSGNLAVTSVTRDGVAVSTVPTHTTFDDGFSFALSGSLVSVVPGGNLTLTWTSDFNQSFGGEALLSTRFTGADAGPGSYYDLSQPGSYAVTFYYQYKGPTSSFPGTVFTGRTNAVTVSFNVV